MINTAIQSTDKNVLVVFPVAGDWLRATEMEMNAAQ